MKNVMNVQDSFLNQARREKITLTVHLVDGSDLHGKVSAFDNFTVILINDEREEQYLIYKHAVATVMPSPKTKVRWNQMDEKAMESGGGGGSSGGSDRRSSSGSSGGYKKRD